MANKPGNQGISSKNLTHRPVKTGSGSRGTRPAGAAQIGIMYGNKPTRMEPTKYSGEPLHGGRSFQATKFGNEIAARTVCKPGGSREGMSSGSQGQHGQVAGTPRPPGRGIMNNE